MADSKITEQEWRVAKAILTRVESCLQYIDEVSMFRDNGEFTASLTSGEKKDPMNILEKM